MGREVDGVVEERTPGRVRCRHWTLAGAGDSAASGAHIDFRFVHGVSQRVRVAGVVGKEVDVYIEGDEKSFILRTQNAAEKGCAGLLLQGENILLAAAGIEQDPQGQRL